MEFFEVVRRRRSIRRFLDEPVPEEHLRAMLEAARLAPSPENAQPWRFLVVRDRGRLREMGEVVAALVDQRLAQAAGDPGREKVIRWLRPLSLHFGDAPCAVFALYRPFVGGRGEYQPLHYDPGLQGVAAAICHLVLAATALGYGSCWATGAVDFAGEEVEALLGVEPPWRLVAVVSLGRAASEVSPRPRKPLEEVAQFLD